MCFTEGVTLGFEGAVAGRSACYQLRQYKCSHSRLKVNEAPILSLEMKLEHPVKITYTLLYS
jgi:hypothetical protein